MAKKKAKKKVIKKSVKKIKKVLKKKKPAKIRKILSVRPSAKRLGGVKKSKKPAKKTKKPAIKKKIKKVIKKKLIARKKKIIKKTIVKKIKRAKAKKVKKIIKRKIVKKSVTEAPLSEFPAEALFKARIKVIGVGGGGGSIVSEIGRSLQKATFVITDTDIRALKKKAGIKYLWFGEELTRGLGTGVNVDIAKQAAEGVREKMGEIFKDQDIIIFIASLGGGLGSGATQIFAEEAKRFGAITLGIFTLPFKFEGKNKSRIALNALKSLRQSLNVSLTIPNEKIFKIIDESTPITSAFSVVNKSLIGSLESLIDLIYSPGIINIDFADLRAILKGRGNLAFLNTIEESGKDRADKICEKVFTNPLLQNNAFTAEKILFNITGADNLSMFEVEKVSSHIANLNPKAKIIFGISKNPKLKNKIKTTILMTGGGDKEALQPKKPEVIKEKVVVIEKLEKKPEKKIELPVIVEEKKKEPVKPPKKTKVPKKPAVKNPAADVKIPAPFAPGLKAPAEAVTAGAKKDLNITETTSALAKKAIRRSAVEIKKAEELEEKKRIAQEKEWEIPAFLRRVKFNK